MLVLLPGTQALAGGPTTYRRLVFFGLPCVFGLVALLAWPRRGGAAAGEGPAPAALPARGATMRLLPWIAAAFVVDQLFILAGHVTGWSTFTFGDQRLHATLRTAVAWALPACLGLGILGWERALRGALLGGWRRRVPPAAAAGMASAVGFLASLPPIVAGAGTADVPYLAAALVATACREVSYSIILLSGGGYVLSGLYRGLFLYVEGFVVSDWYSLWFPAANYVSSDARFYAARGAAAIAAAALVAWGARRTGGSGAAPNAGGPGAAPNAGGPR